MPNIDHCEHLKDSYQNVTNIVSETNYYSRLINDKTKKSNKNKSIGMVDLFWVI